MSTDLANKKCEPRDSGTPLLQGEALKHMQHELNGGWKIAEDKRLERQFKFPDFRQALQFTNRVGEIAEEQGHHPDIYLTWGEVRLQLSTHNVGGLTENDFILAARVNEIA